MVAAKAVKYVVLAPSSFAATVGGDADHVHVGHAAVRSQAARSPPEERPWKPE